jgi:DNA-directed RNA polymerase specialized sigma24 family protein
MSPRPVSDSDDCLAPSHREAVCLFCPIRRTCVEICRPVEALLPSMEQGRVDFEDLQKLYEGRILLSALLDHFDALSKRQQDVVQLYYRENLQQVEIAERLGVSQQAVAESLQRARLTVAGIVRGPRGRAASVDENGD